MTRQHNEEKAPPDEAIDAWLSEARRTYRRLDFQGEPPRAAIETRSEPWQLAAAAAILLTAAAIMTVVVRLDTTPGHTTPELEQVQADIPPDEDRASDRLEASTQSVAEASAEIEDEPEPGHTIGEMAQTRPSTSISARDDLSQARQALRRSLAQASMRVAPPEIPARPKAPASFSLFEAQRSAKSALRSSAASQAETQDG